MKIYHIQYGMTPAGNAAFRLHKAMLKEGIDSYIITYVTLKKANRVIRLGFSPSHFVVNLVNQIINKWRFFTKKKESYYYSALPLIGDNRFDRIIKDADVIYIHWIGGLVLSYRNIEKIAKTGKPIIFFMHDTFTFTGGCHHFFNCENYKTGCNNCIMFSNNNIAHRQALLKKKLFSKYNNFYFISPSNWLAQCAKESYVLYNRDIICINNYIDENQFKPISKKAAREFLGLPQDKFIISFGTQGGDNKYWKGWKFLCEALNRTNFNDVLLAIFGNDYNQETVNELKYSCWFSGQLMDETSLVLINNAVDIYISPSLAESFGMTYIENALCGTPVIGFDCTAVPECVNKETGLLAKYKDIDDLARCIIEIHDNGFKPILRQNYNSQEILQKHIDLIKKIKGKNYIE